MNHGDKYSVRTKFGLFFFCVIVGSHVEISKALQSDSPACVSLVNEERLASFLGPPTDASCSCALLPACAQALLSEDVTTAKLGHRQNLNGASAEWAGTDRLGRDSSFHGLIRDRI